MPFLRREMLLAISVATLSVTFAASSADETFSVSHSTLLFGFYDQLQIVRPRSVQLVTPPVEFPANQGYFDPPSLSATGRFLAWGFATPADDEREHRTRYSLGIYSLVRDAWSTFGDFDRIGAMAVTQDESKVAVVVQNQPLGSLLIFDMATHTFARAPRAAELPYASSISWAPNGSRIVFQTDRYDQPSAISVVDLSTGRVQQIAEGTHPAWSPTGEWIAYVDAAQMTCWLVHPDGTGARVLERLHDDWLHVLLLGYHRLLYGEVWSPDGSEVLLNEENADGPAVRVMLVDVATGRRIRKSRNGVPVFGWARGDAR